MLLSSLYLSRKKSQYSKMQRTAHSHLQVLLPVLHYQIPSPLHHEPKYKHPHTLHGKSVKFTIPIHFFHPWTNFFIIPYFIRTVNTRLIRIKVKFLRLCLLYLVKTWRAYWGRANVSKELLYPLLYQYYFILILCLTIRHTSRSKGSLAKPKTVA